MTHTSAAPSPDDLAPVTIATFASPHEAELAHAALESQGILAVVNNNHGQYPSAGAWVQLQVARGNSELATELLESGPLHATRDADEADDMRPLRLGRRIMVARWFLYAGALMFLLSGLLFPLSVVALGLALWSKQEPRRAFRVARVLQFVVVFVSVASSGLVGLTSLIPLFAFHFAWASAAPTPPEPLAASPYTSLRSIDIGDSWKEVPASGESTQRSIWILLDLGLFLLALMVMWALRMSLSAG